MFVSDSPIQQAASTAPRPGGCRERGARGGGVQEGTSCSALVARLGKGRQRVPQHSRAADGNSEYKILPETAALLQQ